MDKNKKVKIIDVKATTKLGQQICEDYIAILELARANILCDCFPTSSVIHVSNGTAKTTEDLFLTYLNYNPEEPASDFLRMCKEIKKVDNECEYYLICRYFYGKTNEEIMYSDEFYGSKRKFYKIKNKAHLQIACLTGNIVYRQCEKNEKKAGKKREKKREKNVIEM